MKKSMYVGLLVMASVNSLFCASVNCITVSYASKINSGMDFWVKKELISNNVGLLEQMLTCSEIQQAYTNCAQKYKQHDSSQDYDFLAPINMLDLIPKENRQQFIDSITTIVALTQNQFYWHRILPLMTFKVDKRNKVIVFPSVRAIAALDTLPSDDDQPLSLSGLKVRTGDRIAEFPEKLCVFFNRLRSAIR